jgi:hypothetical protein
MSNGKTVFVTLDIGPWALDIPGFPFAFPYGTLVAEGSVDTCLTSGINSQKGESDRPDS